MDKRKLRRNNKSPEETGRINRTISFISEFQNCQIPVDPTSLSPPKLLRMEKTSPFEKK